MKIKKDLLSAIGLNEYAKITSLFLVITFLAAIGIFADSIVDIVEKNEFLKLMISSILFLVVFILYKYIGNRELQLVEKISEGKSILILFFPSNLSLLEKIIKPHRITEIYFLKTRGFPQEEVFKQIEKYLKKNDITFEIDYIDDVKNVKQIKEVVFKRILNLSNIDDVVVNITTGNAVSSLVLSECANYNNVDVEYLGSQYDKYNRPIDNSEKSIIIDFKEEFVK